MYRYMYIFLLNNFKGLKFQSVKVLYIQDGNMYTCIKVYIFLNIF
jgi:hypothetical protein